MIRTYLAYFSNTSAHELRFGEIFKITNTYSIKIYDLFLLFSYCINGYVRPCPDVKDLKCRIEYGKENSGTDANGIVYNRCVPTDFVVYS